MLLDTLSSNDNGSVNTATIGGVTGGVVFLIVIIIVCIVVCCIKQSKKNKEKIRIMQKIKSVTDNDDENNIMNTINMELNTINKSTTLIINNPIENLERSFTQASQGIVNL